MELSRLISFAVALLVLGVLTPQIGQGQGGSDFAIGPARNIDLAQPPTANQLGWRGKVRIIENFADETDGGFAPYLDFIVQNLIPADAWEGVTEDPRGTNVYVVCLSDGDDSTLTQIHSFNVPVSFMLSTSQYHSGIFMNGDFAELVTDPLTVEIRIKNCDPDNPRGSFVIIEGEG